VSKITKSSLLTFLILFVGIYFLMNGTVAKNTNNFAKNHFFAPLDKIVKDKDISHVIDKNVPISIVGFIKESKVIKTVIIENSEDESTEKLARIYRSEKGKYKNILYYENYSIDKNGIKTLVKAKGIVADHIMVQLKAESTLERFAEIVKSEQGEIRRHLKLSKLYLVSFKDFDETTVNKKVKRFLKHSSTVSIAEPDYLGSSCATPNDLNYGNLWGMQKINAETAWEHNTGSKNVVVGIVDSGISLNHPDLVANLWTNPGEIPGNNIDDDNNGYVDDIHGWDWGDGDSDPSDNWWHGSHVAGTIGAVGNNNTGVTGVCWNVSLAALKIRDSGGGYAYSDGAEATAYATTMGMDMTNHSWGGDWDSSVLKNAVAAANSAGVLFIAAAGNSGSDNDSNPIYPASYNYANVISVAATTSNDSKRSNSNYGLTSVDLGAPGENISSTQNAAGYGNHSGTSMATPHVTGVCALIKSYNPSMSASQIKQRLLDSVDPVASMNGKTVSGGRLNAFKALAGQIPFAYSSSEQTNFNTAINITLSAIDPQNDSLSFSVLSSPSSGTLSGSAPNLVYTPNNGYIGNDSFTFKVNDGQNNSNTGTIAIAVEAGAENSAPVAVNGSMTTIENTQVSIVLNVSDVDGDNLTYIISTQPNNGALSGTAPNLTYTPNFNYIGSDSFAFKVNDSQIDSNTATVSITINQAPQPNNAPTVNAGTDQAVVLAEGSSWSPAEITTVAWFDADDASTIVHSNGAVSKWNDKSGNSNDAEQSNASKQPVYNNSDTVLGGKASVGTGGPFGKFLTSPSFGSKRIYAIMYFGNGSESTWSNHNACISGPGSSGQYRLTGRSNDSGPWDTSGHFNDAGAYRDGNVASTSQALPMPSTLWKFESTQIRTQTWRLLCGNQASWSYWDGAFGELIFTDGSEDMMTQQKIEGYLAHKWGITANLPADHPYKSTEPGGSNAVAVLDGTIGDIDGDSLNVQWSKVTGPGSVSFIDENTVDTSASFSTVGSYVLRLSADDGEDQTEDEINITVNDNVPVNDAPIAQNDSFITDEDNSVFVTLVGTDSDGDSLTYSIVNQPLNGVLSGTAPNLIYIPNNGYFGSESFTYKCNDGVNDSNIATISVTINEVMPVNNAPIAQNDSFITDEDNSVSVTLVGTDSDGDSLTYSIVNQPLNGVLSGTAPNLTYIPNNGYFGSESFTYKCNDGVNDSNIATISVTINEVMPVNNAPTVNAGPDQSVFVNGEGLWSPADITTAAWFDANDASTITHSNGAVSKWSDKSGNSNDAVQTDSSKKPIYSNSDGLFSGKPSVGTGGPVGKFLTAPSFGAKRIYAIMYYGNGSETIWSDHNACISGPGNSGQYRMTGRTNAPGPWDNSGNFNDAATYRDGNTVSATQALPMPSTLWKFESSQLRTQTWRLLCGNNASYTYWDGAFGELIFTDGTEDMATQQKIEGYLAHKWGLIGNLPVEHPYKSTAPGGSNAVTNLDGTIADIDGDSLTIQWSKVTGPGSISFLDENTVDTNATFSALGSYVLRLSVDDGLDQVTDEITISVSDGVPVNTAPVAQNSAITTDEDITVGLTLLATDGEGDSLSYIIEKQPTNGSLSGTLPNLTYIPNNGFFGSDSFTFKANDAQVDSNTATVSITINEVIPSNNAPTVDAGPDQNITVSTGGSWSPADITTTAWFDAEDASTITHNNGGVSSWSDKSGNSNDAVQTNAIKQPLYNSADGMLGGKASVGTGGPIGKFLTAPSFGAKRIYAIMYFGNGSETVWPNHNACISGPGGSGQYRLTGRDNVQGPWDTSGHFNNAGTYRDGSTTASPQALPMPSTLWKFEATEMRTQTWRILCGNNASWTYWNGAFGELIFTDGTEDLATQQKIEGYLAHKWGLVENLPSDHPYKSTVPGGSNGDTDTTLDGSIGDADGDPLNIQWTKVTGPGSVGFSNANAVDTTATFSSQGTYVLRLSVDDGIGQSSDELTITVGDGYPINNAPVAQESSINCNKDDTVVVNLMGTDVDGDVLTYSIVSWPSNGSFLQNGSTGTYTPSTGYVGTDSLIFKVYDGSVTSDLATVTIDVQDIPVAQSIHLHNGVVNGVDSNWTTVTLPRVYASMVVVATPVYTELENPVVPRIRNATGNSFEIKLQNPGDLSTVTSSSVHFVVVEEGVYTAAEHGIKLEAVKYQSSVTDGKYNYIAEARNYSNSYDSPVVFGQVMSTNDSRWSTFWCMGSSTQSSPDSSVLYTGKMIGEDNDVLREDETIGYIVVDSGIFSIDGKKVTAGIGSDSIAGIGNSPSYNYSISINNPVESVILGVPGIDGGDGCWAVLYATPTQSELKLAVDEDQISDSERGHTNESLSYFIIESTQP
jgi:subtilisin family serine protease